ncbi:hypothetical protein AURDEDRAFT_124988 [Auricularia subglabra TFB-10046 SS5]|nr:hypothetical protein AURDEDRAFT_124988 [Auricularia subglabra TFB-10046 SS5]
MVAATRKMTAAKKSSDGEQQAAGSSSTDPFATGPENAQSVELPDPGQQQADGPGTAPQPLTVPIQKPKPERKVKAAAKSRTQAAAPVPASEASTSSAAASKKPAKAGTKRKKPEVAEPADADASDNVIQEAPPKKSRKRETAAARRARGARGARGGGGRGAALSAEMLYSQRAQFIADSGSDGEADGDVKMDEHFVGAPQQLRPMASSQSSSSAAQTRLPSLQTVLQAEGVHDRHSLPPPRPEQFLPVPPVQPAPAPVNAPPPAPPVPGPSRKRAQKPKASADEAGAAPPKPTTEQKTKARAPKKASKAPDVQIPDMEFHEDDEQDYDTDDGADETKPGPMLAEHEREFADGLLKFEEFIAYMAAKTGKTQKYLYERTRMRFKMTRERSVWNLFQTRWCLLNKRDVAVGETLGAYRARLSNAYKEEYKALSEEDQIAYAAELVEWTKRYQEEVAKDILDSGEKFKIMARLAQDIEALTRQFYTNYKIAFFGFLVNVDQADTMAKLMNCFLSNCPQSAGFMKAQGVNLTSLINNFASYCDLYFSNQRLADGWSRASFELFRLIGAADPRRKAMIQAFLHWQRIVAIILGPDAPSKVDWSGFEFAVFRAYKRVVNWPHGLPLPSEVANRWSPQQMRRLGRFLWQSFRYQSNTLEELEDVDVWKGVDVDAEDPTAGAEDEEDAKTEVKLADLDQSKILRVEDISPRERAAVKGDWDAWLATPIWTTNRGKVLRYVRDLIGTKTRHGTSKVPLDLRKPRVIPGFEDPDEAEDQKAVDSKHNPVGGDGRWEMQQEPVEPMDVDGPVAPGSVPAAPVQPVAPPSFVQPPVQPVAPASFPAAPAAPVAPPSFAQPPAQPLAQPPAQPAGAPAPFPAPPAQPVAPAPVPAAPAQPVAPGQVPAPPSETGPPPLFAQPPGQPVAPGPFPAAPGQPGAPAPFLAAPAQPVAPGPFPGATSQPVAPPSFAPPPPTTINPTQLLAPWTGGGSASSSQPAPSAELAPTDTDFFVRQMLQNGYRPTSWQAPDALQAFLSPSAMPSALAQADEYSGFGPMLDPADVVFDELLVGAVLFGVPTDDTLPDGAPGIVDELGDVCDIRRHDPALDARQTPAHEGACLGDLPLQLSAATPQDRVLGAQLVTLVEQAEDEGRLVAAVRVAELTPGARKRRLDVLDKVFVGVDEEPGIKLSNGQAGATGIQSRVKMVWAENGGGLARQPSHAPEEITRLGKRVSPDSAPTTPPQKYKRLRIRREKQAATGASPVKTASGDTLLQLRDKINEVIEGRTSLEHLGEWEQEWKDLCELLDERDDLAKKQKQLLKDIGALTTHCERLEARIRTGSG